MDQGPSNPRQAAFRADVGVAVPSVRNFAWLKISPSQKVSGTSPNWRRQFVPSVSNSSSQIKHVRAQSARRSGRSSRLDEEGSGGLKIQPARREARHQDRSPVRSARITIRPIVQTFLSCPNWCPKRHSKHQGGCYGKEGCPLELLVGNHMLVHYSCVEGRKRLRGVAVPATDSGRHLLLVLLKREHALFRFEHCIRLPCVA